MFVYRMPRVNLELQRRKAATRLRKGMAAFMEYGKECSTWSKVLGFFESIAMSEVAFYDTLGPKAEELKRVALEISKRPKKFIRGRNPRLYSLSELQVNKIIHTVRPWGFDSTQIHDLFVDKSEEFAEAIAKIPEPDTDETERKIDQIIKLSADSFNIEYRDIIEGRFTNEIVEARYAAIMYLKKFLPKLTDTEVLSRFGYQTKNRGTKYNIFSLQKKMSADVGLKKVVDRLGDTIQRIVFPN